jgi:hypothetical protein
LTDGDVSRAKFWAKKADGVVLTLVISKKQKVMVDFSLLLYKRKKQGGGGRVAVGAAGS